MIFFSPSPFQRRSMQSFLESAFWYVSFVIASNRLYSFWNESHWKPLTCFNSLYSTGWWLRMRSETVLPKRISIRIYSKYSEYPEHPRRWSVFSSLSEGEEADSAFSYSHVESDTRYRCSWYTRYDFDLEDHPLIKKRVTGQHVGEVPSERSDGVMLAEKSLYPSTVYAPNWCFGTLTRLRHSYSRRVHEQKCSCDHFIVDIGRIDQKLCASSAHTHVSHASIVTNDQNKIITY